MVPIVYHGTHPSRAYDILMDGFRVGAIRNGRGLGHGLYLSETAEFASHWGRIVIRSKISAGTKILWHSKPDRCTLDTLKREFGTGILRPDFWKAVPHNKKLRRDELIAIWNLLIERCYGGENRFSKGYLRHFQDELGRIHEHLRRHQFDGVGFRTDDWPEILLWNPSQVTPISAHVDGFGPALLLKTLKRLRDQNAGDTRPHS